MDDKPAVDWGVIDKLPSKTWAPEVLRQRRILMERVVKSKGAADAAKKIADEDLAAVAAFDEQLRPRIKRRRLRLRHLFGSTVSTSDGKISMSTKNKVLDYNPRLKPEILAELKRRHARKAIRIKEETDFVALGQMSPAFLRTLEHVSVTYGQMTYVSIHSPGEKDATNLLKLRRKGK